jgi:serine/threonine protein kinase
VLTLWLYSLNSCSSRRYMSPEVAFSEPYNAKADIYSFGVLLYELSSLLQPFQGLTMDRHEDEVLRCGNRPCLLGYDYYWPSDLTCLIEECWCNDMRERPTIERVVERLDDCIRDLTSPPPTTEDKQHQKMTAKSLLGSLAHLQLSPLPSGSTCYHHKKTARQA